MDGPVSCAQMTGALGSILILWSGIEREFRDQVAKAHGGKLPKSAHGVASLIRLWERGVFEGSDASPFRSLIVCSLCDELREKLVIRNGLCHGLVGISAGADSCSAALTWELNGEEKSILWGELQAYCSWLSKVPRAISMISRSGSQASRSRMTDSSESRAWWRDEFSIELV